jgi:adenylate cyclase
MEYSLVLILVLFGVNVLARYFAEHRERERLLAAFGQYVPAAVVSQLAHAPGGLRALDGEAREMTVMFCDIKGFTAISEGLRPPELVQLLNAVLSPVTRVVHRHHGTVDKYIGDAVMAFWGAPLPDPDHAYHAVLAALELGSTLERLRRQFRARGWPDVEMGTGINTGVVNVGNMGSEFRMAYTVVGDAVNLAARLETLTRALRVSALVTEATARAAPGIVYRELGKVRIRGRQQPVRVYEPVCRAEDLSPQTRAWLEQHVRALGSFYARRWDEAVTRFGRLWQDRPDDAVYEVYLKIVAAYTRGPRPPDWDGELALVLI